MRIFIWALFFFSLSLVYADVVYFKNGQMIEGEIKEKGKKIKIITPSGFLVVPKSAIKYIKKRESVEEVFLNKKNALDVNKPEQWYNLFLWAKRRHFPRERLLSILDNVLTINPNHQKARTALMNLLIAPPKPPKLPPNSAKKTSNQNSAPKKVKKATLAKASSKRKRKRKSVTITLGKKHYSVSANVKALENFVDDLYEVTNSLPVIKFSQRGGLNILFSFVFRKALQVGFTREKALELANEYKNIAALGGDLAFDSMRSIYFSILKLHMGPNPFRSNPLPNVHLQPVTKNLFLFAKKHAAKGAGGGRNGNNDFDKAYRLIFHRLYDQYYLQLNESDSFRIAVKSAAIVAAGGGFNSFRRAYEFHFRIFRKETKNRKKAIVFALHEALEENKHPKRLFNNRRRR